MSRMFRFSLVALALVLVVTTFTQAGVPANGTPKKSFFPSDSKPFGQSYTEWSADWWRWALSIPPEYMPILDPTGDACAVGQHGPVWFLSGNFGGVSVRSCAVPADKALFFPLINCEWENIWIGQPILSLDELFALCALPGDPILTLEIDGVAPLPSTSSNPRDESLLDFRATAGPFDYSFPLNNLAAQPQGVYYPAISDGYWMMLKPLSPGAHTVRFTADNGFGFNLDVTYNLQVIALEGLCASPPCP